MKKNSSAEFTVSVPELGMSFPCRSDESLYSAMHRAGIFKGGCQGGGCGMCKVRLLGGEVSCNNPMSREHVTREEEAEGYILACCARLGSGIIVTLNG